MTFCDYIFGRETIIYSYCIETALSLNLTPFWSQSNLYFLVIVIIKSETKELLSIFIKTDDFIRHLFSLRLIVYAVICQYLFNACLAALKIFGYFLNLLLMTWVRDFVCYWNMSGSLSPIPTTKYIIWESESKNSINKEE